jgi:hypothetical protein
MVTGPAHYPQSWGRQIFASRLALHLSQNPNGIPYDSPGLRAPRYPGKGSRRMINPNGVVSSCFNPISISYFSFDPFCRMFLQQPTSFVRTQPRWGWGFKPVIPQGSTQPWAMGRNPVGIREREGIRAPIRAPNFMGNEQPSTTGSCCDVVNKTGSL